MRSTQIVVIGAGPGGCAAAVQCKRLGVTPTLLDYTGKAGGLLTNGFLVENYPGLEAPIKGSVFCERLAEHLSRFKVEIESARVISVNAAGSGWLIESDKGLIETSNVILCTGTTPLTLPIQKQKETPVIYNEVRSLLAENSSAKSVLIIGGGEAAFDFSLSVLETGARVSILVRGAHERVRGRLPEMVANTGLVTVEYGVSLVSVKKIENELLAVIEGGGKREERRVSAVLAAIGRKSTAGEIVADISTLPMPVPLTPSNGLFICGDARSGALGQAGIAVGDGLAAAAMAVRNTV